MVRLMCSTCGFTDALAVPQCALNWLESHMFANAVPNWSAVAWVVAEVIFGGRVTDPFDRRVLSVLTSTFLCPALVSGSFTFSRGEGGAAYGVCDQLEIEVRVCALCVAAEWVCALFCFMCLKFVRDTCVHMGGRLSVAWRIACVLCAL